MNKITQIELFENSGYTGFGPLGFETRDAWASFSTLNKVLSLTIGVMTAIAAIWLVFKIASGALAIMASGGDKQKMADARSSITTGVVGFVIMILAVFIMDLFGNLLGIKLLDGLTVFLLPNYNPLIN